MEPLGFDKSVLKYYGIIVGNDHHRIVYDLAMEYIEGVKTEKECWTILHSIGADIDDHDVMWALEPNPWISYTSMENYDPSTGEVA